MYACMYACMLVCMYGVDVCAHACMNVCMHVCLHLCMYTFMHACVHVCMHVCMYAFVACGPHWSTVAWGDGPSSRDVFMGVRSLMAWLGLFGRVVAQMLSLWVSVATYVGRVYVHTIRLILYISASLFPIIYLF